MRISAFLTLFGLLTACDAAPPLPAVTPIGPPAPAIPSSVAEAGPANSAALNPASAEPASLSVTSLPLPGAVAPASLDYLACDRAAGRVWVPVGSTGSVDVLDLATGAFTRVNGFATAEREVRGKKRTMGPSSASVGDGFVYVGNRASNEVCAVDAKTLALGNCLKLGKGPDGVSYVAAAKEVWVTTPADQTITILDASKPARLAAKAMVKVDGAPEGYAVDEAHGIFFTNLEDKGGTVVLDIKTRKAKATWNPGCGAEGPRGIAFDPSHDFLFVACTDHVQVLDAGHDGAALGKLETGAGVDNIDYVEGRLYVAAGKVSRLLVATVDDRGQLTTVATGHTSEGARNAVADGSGKVFVADSLGARLLELEPGSYRAPPTPASAEHSTGGTNASDSSARKE
jgi:hypothetical protein